MSFQDSSQEYHKYLENIQNYFEHQRVRAQQALFDLQEALMLQIQQLEDSYMKVVNFTVCSETDRNMTENVYYYWNINLNKICEMENSVLFQVRDCNKVRTQYPATCVARDKAFSTANNYNDLSKDNHTLSLSTKEHKVDLQQTSYKRETNKPISSMKPMSYTNCTYTTTTVQTDQFYGRNVKPTYTFAKSTGTTLTNTSNKTSLDRHKSYNDTRQPVMHLSESNPVRGLRNTRNTCYMNSILQCLSHTLPLREFYVSDEYKQFLNKRGDLSSAFKRVMVELWDSTSQLPVDPYVLRREVKARTDRFPVDRQHDAHEFMGFLLNELHEGINRARVKGRKSPADNETLGEACARHLTWENSRISELFGGMLRSEVCCSVCSDKSIVYIPFLDIALPIPERIQRPYHNDSPYFSLIGCLNMITAKEILDGEERPYCNKCMGLTKSTKLMSIAELPKFLVIQLKRFSFNPVRTKLSTPVIFNYKLILKDIASTNHTYSLYGVVCHSGSISAGHYKAYCRHRDRWRCFDDEFAYNVSWKQVQLQEAYLLFYQESCLTYL